MAYQATTEKLPVLNVSLRPNFTNIWRRGRYARSPETVADHFNSRYGIAYVDRQERPGKSISLVLKFSDYHLAVPIHPDGSPERMEANAFYHEQKRFQLGRKKTRPAKINGSKTTPGVVNVLWKTMY
ncbi:MAG: hypothetical protein HY515_03560, partial [Candidatus Aenigmarchaeota archaeon]|nr:hypothetical protein [Candidatus Aenigmarchaeota archaeon]